MNIVSILLAAGLTAASVGYHNPNEGKPVLRGEARVNFDRADPEHGESDAKANVGRGDCHLLGIYGIGKLIVEATKDEHPPRGWKHSILYIEDTGDYFRDESQQMFEDRADRYAFSYNSVVLATRECLN